VFVALSMAVLLTCSQAKAENVREMYMRAKEMHSAGDLECAERGFRSILEVDQGNVFALRELGVVLAKQNDLPKQRYHFVASL
jgi:hypothetical protein